MKSNKIKDFVRGAIASAAFALMIAVGGSFAPVEVAAAPLMKGAITGLAAEDSGVILVRDGCGRGMRFSNSRQTCVEDFGGGGPRFVAPGCPEGTRFSERRQACVELGYVDPGAAIVNGIIGGVLGATEPRGCGPGMRWSNRRGGCVYD